MDLYRISSLSLESINHNNYKGIIGIQVIGMQVTFYISTLLSKQFYVMMEICSITLPKDLTEIMSYFANVSDLLPVSQYYENSFELINSVVSESHMDTFDGKKKSYVHQKTERENALLSSTINRTHTFFISTIVYIPSFHRSKCFYPHSIFIPHRIHTFFLLSIVSIHFYYYPSYSPYYLHLV